MRRMPALFLFFLFLFAAFAFVACGGGSNSGGSGTTAGTTTGSTTSTPPPGGTSGTGSGTTGSTTGSGTGGSTSGGGTTTGGSTGSGTGGSSTGGGTTGGGTTGSSSATFVYVGIELAPSAPVAGFRLDEVMPNITELPGSPFGQPTNPRGPLVISRSFVYTVVQDEPNTTRILAMRADTTSGALTQIGSTTFNGPGAALISDPLGRNLYAILSGGNIASYIINSDGTLASAGPPLHLADGIAAAAMSPNDRFGYAITETQLTSDPRGSAALAIVLLRRDQNSGALSLGSQVANDRAVDLKLDPSGKYLVAVKDDFKRFLVYRVDDSTGALTSVAGSPFVSAGDSPDPDFTRPFAFSPDGRFVYAVDSSEVNERRASIWAFSLEGNSGALTRLQTFDLAPGSNAFYVAVENSLLVLVATSNDSTITLIRRDPSTGLLSAAGSPLGGKKGLQNIGIMHF